jgi:hypothetical protein
VVEPKKVIPIRSLSEFWEAIQEFAQTREDAELPSSPEQKIAFSVIFQRTDGKEKKAQGFQGNVQGDLGYGIRGIEFAMNPKIKDVFKDRFKLINKTNRDLEIKARDILARTDVNVVYPPLEKAAFLGVSKNVVYRNVLRLCQKFYGGVPTLAVGWHKDLKTFALYINKSFCLKFCFHYLFGNWGKSNYERLLKEVNEYDVLAQALQFLIMHEMGHILFKHTSKKADIFKDYNPEVLNIYGDALININLTGIMRSEGPPKGYQGNIKHIDITRAPLAGVSNRITHDFLVKGRTLLDFYTKTNSISGVRVQPYVGEPKISTDAMYAGVLEENPLALVKLGLNTSTVIKFFDTIQAMIGTDPMTDTKYKVGDLVKNKNTEAIGTVVKANRDGTYTVEYPKEEEEAAAVVLPKGGT